MSDTTTFNLVTLSSAVEHHHVTRDESGVTVEMDHGAAGSPLHHLLSSLSTCIAMTFQGIARRAAFDFLDMETTISAKVGTAVRPWSVLEADVHMRVECPPYRKDAQEQLDALLEQTEQMCFVSKFFNDAGVKVTLEGEAVEFLNQ